MVFAKARVGIADGADHAALQVAAPVDEVQHVARVRIHHQAVDGEIAAQHVLARIGLEANLFGMAAVDVIVIAAKGGHFHLVEHVAHQHHSEVRAHPAGVGEEVHDAVGPRIGGDVEVFGLARPAADRARSRPPGRPGVPTPRSFAITWRASASESTFLC